MLLLSSSYQSAQNTPRALYTLGSGQTQWRLVLTRKACSPGAQVVTAGGRGATFTPQAKIPGTHKTGQWAGPLGRTPPTVSLQAPLPKLSMHFTSHITFVSLHLLALRRQTQDNVLAGVCSTVPGG
jgi:hypothetical protein